MGGINFGRVGRANETVESISGKSAKSSKLNLGEMEWSGLVDLDDRKGEMGLFWKRG